MNFKRVYEKEPKHLADFYNGECFYQYDLMIEDEVLMMAIGDPENPDISGERRVLNLDTAEVSLISDDIVLAPVVVDIQGLGE